MGLQKEVWSADIQETLHEKAHFVAAGTDHSAYISDKTVNLPQAGVGAGIQKNRTVVPAPIAQRTDTIKSYDMNEYTIDPTLIKNLDELQTSYQKRQDILRQNVDLITERIGKETAYDWAGSANSDLVLRTTGLVGGDRPNATATGTRRLLLKEDIARMAKKLDIDEMPDNDRFLVLPASMYYELFGIDALIRKDFGGVANINKGVVNELFGFKIFKKSSVLNYNAETAGVKKAVGSADEPTDCLGAIAFHKSAVSKAMGSVEVFASEDKPEYYGSIFSALMMHGSSVMRSDHKGIVSLAQGYVAPIV
jgi:hypothetical protein